MAPKHPITKDILDSGVLRRIGEAMEKQSNQQRRYLKQIEKFYNNSLNRYEVIQIGQTPNILRQFGAKQIPLVMDQKNLRKSVREERGSRSAHEINREIIETIPEHISEPIFVVKEESRNSLALILDDKDKKGRNILVAIKLDVSQNTIKVNEIKSIYGRENLKNYLLQKMEGGDLFITDIKKSEELYETLDVHIHKGSSQGIPGSEESVKGKTGKKEIVGIIRKAGFRPTKTLIKNMLQLQKLSGRIYEFREIHRIGKNNYQGLRDEEKAVMKVIVKECQGQERQKRMKSRGAERD